MMMPILTRLLVTKIVASNRSGRSSSLEMVLLFLELLFRMVFTSAGDNEKNEASEPEISADNTSKIKITIKAIPRFKVNGFTVKSNAESKIS